MVRNVRLRPFHNPHLVKQQNQIYLRLILLELLDLFCEAF